MKQHGIGQFLLSGRHKDRKYPDAVFQVQALGKSRTIALEYEREQKSASRYRSILAQYAGVTNLSMILFAVERPAIQKAIERAKQYVGQNEVTNKLAFVTSKDWQRSPLDAPIEVPSGRTSFRQMCAIPATAAA